MNRKIQLLAVIIFLITTVATAQTGNKVRLSKTMYKGNDFSEVIEYSYNADGTIKKIVESQNNKLNATIDNFIFNEKGLVTGYIKTFNLNISPQKTTILYDEQNRISSFKVIKTKDNKSVKVRAYSYNGDTVKVTEPQNLSQTTLYIFNSDSNIIKIQGLGSPSVAFTNLYEKYDIYKNPQTLVGGFVDEKPITKNNSLEDNYVDIYILNRKIEYQKTFASQYRAGSAKIPTQFKNGLPLKEIVTRFDKAYNKVMPVSVTTYQYINL
jgi:hypothetical protein